MRVAFLGPEGTYSHEALRRDPRAEGLELAPEPTVFDAVLAVEQGRAGRALVPIENSTEGAVGVTLDALSFETERVRIVGEVLLPVTHALIGRSPVDLAEVRAVLSHPQATAQSARFLRERMPGAQVVPVDSTATAVRMIAEGTAPAEPAAAIGTHVAAEIHGAVVLEDGIQDESTNVTRFVWLAPQGTPALGEPSKTSVVFWGAGDETAGWLVRCLSEFAFRGVNLTRIESRPRRMGLGHYMFFVDCDGAADSRPVADAIAAVEGQAQNVKVLGSYPGG